MRVISATVILALAIAIEGLWIMIALAVGGNRNGWLDFVIGAWWLMALALFLFWRLPIISVAAAAFNLIVCVRTFYAPGQDFHDPERLLYRHSIDLVILAATILGFHTRRVPYLP